MKDRNLVCAYYVCAGADCIKGLKKVTVDKCKNCPKYRPRKSNHRTENIKIKRRKDIDRHDNWKLS